MSQTICRMYASHDQALKAAHALETHRFDRFDAVRVIGRDDAHASVEALTAAIMKGWVLKAQAKVFAEGVARGGALVIVQAPFGSGVSALEILQSFDPIDSGVPDVEDRAPVWDEATPVSNVLGLRVLLDDSASFARFWNVPALSKKPVTWSTAMSIPEISRPSGPFTGTFGMALLSNKATILSSMLGLPLLSKRRAG